MNIRWTCYTQWRCHLAKWCCCCWGLHWSLSPPSIWNLKMVSNLTISDSPSYIYITHAVLPYTHILPSIDLLVSLWSSTWRQSPLGSFLASKFASQIIQESLLKTWGMSFSESIYLYFFLHSFYRCEEGKRIEQHGQPVLMTGPQCQDAEREYQPVWGFKIYSCLTLKEAKTFQEVKGECYLGPVFGGPAAHRWGDMVGPLSRLSPMIMLTHWFYYASWGKN